VSLPSQVEPTRRESVILGIVLLAGLIHGLLYVFLVPPWQHYDEPGHFEYAWLLANRPGLPASDDYDQGIRREIAASMIEHGFFERLGFRPNLVSQLEPVWIGISQLNDPPLYYWLVALPLRLVQTSDVTFQLYLSRLVSFSLYMLTIVTAYGLLVEITPPGHFLRWLTPLTIAMLPAYTDLTTAVNNDVGATLFFSLFIWLSVRTLRRGFHGLRLVGLISLAVLCLWTKNTVTLAIPLLLFPAILPIWPKRLGRGIFWVGAALICAIGLVASLRWDHPALWYSQLSQISPARAVEANAPIGDHIFRLDSKPSGAKHQIVQAIPPEQIEALRGQVVTLGAWMWATESGQIVALALAEKGQIIDNTTVQVGVTPAFFAFTAQIPDYASYFQIVLTAPQRAVEHPITVYYDGIVLVPGDFTASGAPIFDNAQASEGAWGDIRFTNLARNASAEIAGPRLRPTIDRLFGQIFPVAPSTIIGSLTDLAASGWTYRASLDNLFYTFWGRFGWSHITLPGQLTFPAFWVVTGIGILGALSAAWQYRRTLPGEPLMFLGLALVLVWATTLLRGANSAISAIFFPAARYAYPVIIPSMLILTTGWSQVPRLLNRWIFFHPRIWVGIYLALLLALDVFSLSIILSFYKT
jgi:hypothetical protein